MKSLNTYLNEASQNFIINKHTKFRKTTYDVLKQSGDTDVIYVINKNNENEHYILASGSKSDIDNIILRTGMSTLLRHYEDILSKKLNKKIELQINPWTKGYYFGSTSLMYITDKEVLNKEIIDLR